MAKKNIIIYKQKMNSPAAQYNKKHGYYCFDCENNMYLDTTTGFYICDKCGRVNMFKFADCNYNEFNDWKNTHRLVNDKKYYDKNLNVINFINNSKLPQNIKSKLVKVFNDNYKEINIVYLENEKKNFNYNYLVYKLLEITGNDQYKSMFEKNNKKSTRKRNNKIWNQINFIIN